MRLEVLNMNDLDNNYEALGVCYVSSLTALLHIFGKAASTQAILDINLKVQQLNAAIFNLFPTALSSGEGSASGEEYFQKLKAQAFNELESIIAIAEEFKNIVAKENKNKVN